VKEMSLTAKEFHELPDDDKKGERYKEMSSHEAFIYRTCYMPFGPGKLTGFVERTDEEMRESTEDAIKIIERLERKPMDEKDKKRIREETEERIRKKHQKQK